jgi:hypothetical protein
MNELNTLYDGMKVEDSSNKAFLTKLAEAVSKIRNGLVK